MSERCLRFGRHGADVLEDLDDLCWKIDGLPRHGTSYFTGLLNNIYIISDGASAGSSWINNQSIEPSCQDRYKAGTPSSSESTRRDSSSGRTSAFPGPVSAGSDTNSGRSI